MCWGMGRYGHLWGSYYQITPIELHSPSAVSETSPLLYAPSETPATVEHVRAGGINKGKSFAHGNVNMNPHAASRVCH